MRRDNPYISPATASAACPPRTILRSLALAFAYAFLLFMLVACSGVVNVFYVKFRVAPSIEGKELSTLSFPLRLWVRTVLFYCSYWGVCALASFIISFVYLFRSYRAKPTG